MQLRRAKITTRTRLAKSCAGTCQYMVGMAARSSFIADVFHCGLIQLGAVKPVQETHARLHMLRQILIGSPTQHTLINVRLAVWSLGPS